MGEEWKRSDARVPSAPYIVQGRKKMIIHKRERRKKTYKHWKEQTYTYTKKKRLTIYTSKWEQWKCILKKI